MMKKIGFALLGLLFILFFILPAANAAPDKETIEFTLSDGVTLRESNVYVQGSTIDIAIHTPIQYNINRIVAVDYLFVIEDPKENPVHIAILKNRSRSYIKESSVHFSKSIPQEWIDGEYTIRIFIIDRGNPEYATKKLITTINPDIGDDKVSSLEKFFSTSDDSIMIDYGLMQTRGDAFAVKRKLTFLLDREAKPYFVRSISVPEYVPPESTVTVIVVLENTAPKTIEDKITPVLNGKQINEVSFSLPSSGSKEIQFEIIKSSPGLNTLQIGSKNASYEVEVIPVKPTEFIYNDLSTDRIKVYKGEALNVSVGVFNTGENGTKQVVLLLNEEIKAVQDVTLGYGDSKIVYFNITLDSPGVYQANIQGTDFKKIIVVQDKITDEMSGGNGTEKIEEYPTSFILGLGIILIVIIIAAGIYVKKYIMKKE